MRIRFSIVFIALNTFLLSNFIFAQSDSTTSINKYEEFALFVTGQEFPKSITDTSIDLTFWKDYQAKINVDWPEMDSSRLKPMNAWRRERGSPRISDSLLLFYPFSGPDFFTCQCIISLCC
jgi:hypothetical protein